MKSKNQNISWPVVILVGLVVVAAFFVFGGNSAQNGNTKVDLGETYGTAVLNIPVTQAELGDVSQKKGIVEKVFVIKNDGDGPLRIGALETSCACTSAQLEVGEKTGPKYGMPGHGPSSRSWAMDIPEGGEGNLRVYYDPNKHGPSGVGPFERDITFTTNDKNAPNAGVRIAGVTVK